MWRQHRCTWVFSLSWPVTGSRQCGQQLATLCQILQRNHEQENRGRAENITTMLYTMWVETKATARPRDWGLLLIWDRWLVLKWRCTSTYSMEWAWRGRRSEGWTTFHWTGLLVSRSYSTGGWLCGNRWELHIALINIHFFAEVWFSVNSQIL